MSQQFVAGNRGKIAEDLSRGTKSLGKATKSPGKATEGLGKATEDLLGLAHSVHERLLDRRGSCTRPQEALRVLPVGEGHVPWVRVLPMGEGHVPWLMCNGKWLLADVQRISIQGPSPISDLRSPMKSATRNPEEPLFL